MSFKKYLINQLFSSFIKPFGRVICILQYKQASKKTSVLLEKRHPNVFLYLQKQRENSGFSLPFSEYKLYELCQFLHKYKPKTILELGGGSTSAALIDYAVYMKKNGITVSIVSVDESEFYLNQTKTTLEKIYALGELDIKFTKSDRQENKDGCFYGNIGNITSKLGTIDLVYVDGPSAPNRIPCIDITLIKNEIKNVLFDHRTPSVTYCEKFFETTHDLARHYSINNDIWIADKYHHHSSFLKI